MLNAAMREEFTADGRSDNTATAKLILNGIRFIESDSSKSGGNDSPSSEPDDPDKNLKKSDSTKDESVAIALETYEFYDAKELSLISYLIDAILCKSKHFDENFFKELVKFANRLNLGSDSTTSNKMFSFVENIEGFYSDSKTHPDTDLGDLGTRGVKRQLKDLFYGVIKDVEKSVSGNGVKTNRNSDRYEASEKYKFWKALVTKATEKLDVLMGNDYRSIISPDFKKVGNKTREPRHDAVSEVRLYYLCYLSILWSIYRRLQHSLRSRKTLDEESIGFVITDLIDQERFSDDRDLFKKCQKLVKEIEEQFRKYQDREIIKKVTHLN